jgi:ribosomal protein L21E
MTMTTFERGDYVQIQRKPDPSEPNDYADQTDAAYNGRVARVMGCRADRTAYILRFLDDGEDHGGMWAGEHLVGFDQEQGLAIEAVNDAERAFDEAQWKLTSAEERLSDRYLQARTAGMEVFERAAERGFLFDPLQPVTTSS